jgi:hypothetical protein
MAFGLACGFGCGDAAPPRVFIALQRDFAPFEAWAAYDLGEVELEGHPRGRRVAHLNRAPPPGSADFPVGTIVVKTTQAAGTSTATVHAMVKRGGEFNALGAAGWEWFELALVGERVPVILWRGDRPPDGERYECPAASCEDAPDCNRCHQAAASNDYVMSSLLQLSGF